MSIINQPKELDYFLTPVGRIVQGAVLEQTKSTMFSDKNDSEEKVAQFYIALAIPKDGRPWQQTEWGKRIYDTGVSSFPNGQHAGHNFYWKMVDGDDAIPDKSGVKPCDKQGFKNCWVLKFKTMLAPKLLNERKELITDTDLVHCGDYVQVLSQVKGNGVANQAGVYLNHKVVVFRGRGERIFSASAMPDISDLNFDASLPSGVSMSPPPASITPAATQTVQVEPHRQILDVPAAAPNTPPAPAAVVPAAPPATPIFTMTALANGATREQFIANGWTDEQLINHGYMVKNV